MNTQCLKTVLLTLCFWLGAMSTAVAQPHPEVDQQIRDTAVQAQLKAKPKAVLLYAKGMCCPSCAIGIRRMISRLAFVDTDAKESGIELDAKHQLVTVTLKKNAKADLSALSEALNDAGYDPVHAYVMKKGKVVTSALTPQTYRVVP
jgi:copper chaperone CopZ